MITLIKDGSSEYQILIAQGASESICWAANELRRILCRMTGVTLMVDTLPAFNTGLFCPVQKSIFVGDHPLLKEKGIQIDWESLGEEGYRILCHGEDIVIAGSGKRGAMYGVFSFMEKYLGVRFMTADIEHVPVRKSVMIPKDLDESYVPVLEYREVSFWEGRIDGAWCAHNKSNGHNNCLSGYQGGKYTYYPFVHSFNMLVPPEKYFEEHPEYYAEIDGVRKSAQLCLTNEDVFQIALDTVRSWIKENPEATIISVSQNDGYNPCTCEKCRALDEYEESQAGSLLTFVNKIAAVIAVEYPHILIDTLAYIYTRKPPKHVRPLPNVIVRLCDIECCFSHPLKECKEVAYPYKKEEWLPKQHFADALSGWSKVHDRLYVWDYVTNFAHPFVPFPNFKVLQANIKFFIENNVKGIFEQGALWYGGGGSMGELRNYVLAKLLWNPDCDVDMLVDEFLAVVYKSTAPLMRRYFDLVHSRLENVHMGIYDPEDNTYGNKELTDRMNDTIRKMREEGRPEAEVVAYGMGMKTFALSPEKLKFLTVPMVEEMHKLFDEMELLADDASVLRRVQRERLGIRYLELYLEDPNTEEHIQNVDEFFADLKAYGICCVSENRRIWRSEEMMKKGEMHLWNCLW